MDISSIIGAVGEKAFDYFTSRKDAYDMYDYQNTYNSPKAQLQRLQAAGMSPLLLDPSGGASSTMNVPTPVGSAMDKATASQLSKAQAKQIYAQAEKTETETDQLKMMFNYVLTQARHNTHLLGNQVIDSDANVQFAMPRAEMNQELLALILEEKGVDIEVKKQAWNFAQKMQPYQLAQIMQEVRKLKLTNKGLSYDNQVKKVGAELAEKYHILPTDDGFKALIHMLLSGDGSKIAGSLMDFGRTFTKGAIDSIKQGWQDYMPSWLGGKP